MSDSPTASFRKIRKLGLGETTHLAKLAQCEREQLRAP